MNIITGLAKGIKLETLEGDATRPTSQRVKEAIFSMIQFEIENTRFLDLFSGSGQMGLEAVSRGATVAVMSDVSREAVDIIIRNAKKTRLFDKCRISCCDYSQAIRGARGKEKFDFVFIDPPYNQKIIPEVLKSILDAGILNYGARVICESAEKLSEYKEEILSKFNIVREAKYSITYITILEVKNDE